MLLAVDTTAPAGQYLKQIQTVNRNPLGGTNATS